MAVFSFKEARGNEFDGQWDEDESGYVQRIGAFGSSHPAQAFGTVDPGSQFVFSQLLHFDRALQNFVGSFFQPFIQYTNKFVPPSSRVSHDS